MELYQNILKICSGLHLWLAGRIVACFVFHVALEMRGQEHGLVLQDLEGHLGPIQPLFGCLKPPLVIK